MKRQWYGAVGLLLSLQLVACYQGRRNPRHKGLGSPCLEILNHVCHYFVDGRIYKDSVHLQYQKEADALVDGLIQAQQDTLTSEVDYHSVVRGKLYHFLLYVPIADEAAFQDFSRLAIHRGQDNGVVQTDVVLEHTLKPPLEGYVEYSIQYGMAVKRWRVYLEACPGNIGRVELLQNDAIPDEILACQRLLGAAEFKEARYRKR